MSDDCKDIDAHTLKQIDKAVEILKQGGVIAFPTETVYGLGASIAVPEAASRIYRIKGRDFNKALPLVLSDNSQVELVASSVPEAARQLIKAFWPGRLTLIVSKSKAVPDTITANRTTVAIRVTSDPVAKSIIRKLGIPITGTSANKSGKPSPATPQAVKDQLGDEVDLIVGGGHCGGVESTIIDVTKSVPVIVREGAIKYTEIIELGIKVIPNNSGDKT